MFLKQISDRKLAQHAYLLGCETSKQAIIVDPERDIDRYFEVAKTYGLTLVAAAETHIHADYLSGLRQCAEAGLKIFASGAGDEEWQYFWLKESTYSFELLRHQDSFNIGTIRLEAVHSPGHTPEHLSYLVYENSRDADHALALISGDFLFVADLGRPDLLETAAGYQGTMRASARSLYQSVVALRSLSPTLMVLPNHSAGSSCGKGMSQTMISTLGYELAANPALKAASSETAFVDYILTGQPEPAPYFARMKNENRSGPALLAALPSPKILAAHELSMLERKDVIVVDTRPWNDFRTKRIRGSIFAPLDKEFPTTIGSYLLPEQTICLVVSESQLDEAIRDCIRIGLDGIEYVLIPTTFANLPESNLIASGTREMQMTSLPSIVSDADAILLDVRKASELSETGRIANAMNIPHVQLASRHWELSLAGNIHLWCRSGNRSRAAYSYLEHVGYRATLMDGGIAAWQEMRGELVPVNA